MKWSLGRTVLLVALAGVTLTQAQEAAPKPEKNLEAAVEWIMTHMMRDDSGLCWGMARDRLPVEGFGAAQTVSLHAFPLSGTQYAPGGGDWQGVVEFVMGEGREGRLNELRVALLAGTYDRRKLGEFVVSAGERLDLDLKPDPDNEYLYFDGDFPERFLMIGLGRGVVLFEIF